MSSSEDLSSDEDFAQIMSSKRRTTRVGAGKRKSPTPASVTKPESFAEQHFKKLMAARNKKAKLEEMEEESKVKEAAYKLKKKELEEKRELMRIEDAKRKELMKRDKDDVFARGNERMFKHITEKVPAPYVDLTNCDEGDREQYEMWNSIMCLEARGPDGGMANQLKASLVNSGAWDRTVACSKVLMRLLFEIAVFYDDINIRESSYVALEECIHGIRLPSKEVKFNVYGAAVNSTGFVGNSDVDVCRWMSFMGHHENRIPVDFPKRAMEVPWVPTRQDFIRVLTNLGASFAQTSASSSSSSSSSEVLGSGLSADEETELSRNFHTENVRCVLVILEVCLKTCPERYTLDDKIFFVSLLARMKIDPVCGYIVSQVHSTMLVAMDTLVHGRCRESKNFDDNGKRSVVDISNIEEDPDVIRMQKVKQCAAAILTPDVSTQIPTLTQLILDSSDLVVLKARTNRVNLVSQAMAFSLLKHLFVNNTLPSPDVRLTVPVAVIYEPPTLQEIIAFLRDVEFEKLAPNHETENLEGTCDLLLTLLKLLDASLGVGLLQRKATKQDDADFESIMEEVGKFKNNIRAGQKTFVVELTDSAVQLTFKHSAQYKFG